MALNLERFNPGAWAVKVLGALVFLATCLMAACGMPGALKLWVEGWAGSLALWTMFFGLSWIKDIAHREMDVRLAKTTGEPPPAVPPEPHKEETP